MPRGDGTGPDGRGQMTGRAAGYCAGFDMPGFANPIPRRGMGRRMGRGFGRGLGRGFGWRSAAFAPVAPVVPVYQEPTKEQELQYLEQESKALEEEQKLIKKDMEEIKKRIEELRKSK
ncbi:DUF5320 domain-containing protein [Candidatus Woesearchaeota archaeon]|nr:DUF5320 domain-containing protein [Candidatus Woesearchaeota archaeon]